MRLLGGLLCGWLGAGLALAAPPVTIPEQPDEQEAAAQLERLSREFKKLGDWEGQFRIIDRAMDNIWSRNHWDSEADLFARETVREVAKIPPWELDRRLDRLAERFSDRYELGPAQRARFRGVIYRETFGFMWSNAGELFEQVRQSVGARVGGQPFTQEQVAEWTRRSEPMMADMQQRIDRMVEELGGTVDKAHRDRFERDLESFERRQAYVYRLRESWKEGGWKPEDWGLEDDPIQRGAGRPPSQSRAEENKPAYSKTDPATWEAYVRDFIRRYKLDRGQAAAAESILVELLSRALSYLRANAEALAAISPEERADHELLGPIKAMFTELRSRLERIPTAAQRRDAQAEPTAVQ
ncbi:MAG: hypothetical protein ACYSUQ_09680 [Planctomycetota bacterium]|jgi:hypothetical protein